jgi:hypothetical protein
MAGQTRLYNVWVEFKPGKVVFQGAVLMWLSLQDNVL